jgi:phosphotransferase system  glucose/maltose/N-acetylglucosamine-specific IIC component
MMMITWALFGVLIGIAAAQKKGFSMVGGVIGGLLLGPLAFLMFFISGVSGSDANKKCPHCAEWIKADAIVCKHCHRDVPAIQTTGTRPVAVRPPSQRRTG